MPQYSQAQKLAYYRRLARQRSSRKSYYSGKGAYRKKKSYSKRSRYTNGWAQLNDQQTRAAERKQMAEGGALAGAALGGLLGSAFPGIGTAVGATVGSAAGGMAGYGLASIMGYGKYKVKKNVFMEGRLPQVMNIPKAGGTVIRFQEYLGDVYTTANIGNPAEFNIQNFLINAANTDTFPWLAQIAANYEQYSFEGLLFQFRSTSADALNSTNTALGSVIMATQYDVADPVFRSKTEMLNYEYSCSVKPSENCMHMIECAPAQTPVTELFTLDGAAPANTDARLYHLGRFCIATVGFQAANVNIGELHVTYQVRLLKPKLYSTLGNFGDYAYLLSANYSNAQPLVGPFSRGDSSNFAVTVSSGTCVLPASSVIKTYRIEVDWIGSGSVAIALSPPTVANCTLLQSSQRGGTATAALCTFLITTLGNSLTSSFSWSNQTLPTTPLNCIIRVMQVPQTTTQ